MESQDKLSRERRDFPECLENKDDLAVLGHLVLKEMQVYQDCQEVRARKEILDYQESLVPEESLVQQDDLVFQVEKEIKEKEDTTVSLGSEERKEKLDCQAAQDLSGLQELQENRGGMVL